MKLRELLSYDEDNDVWDDVTDDDYPALCGPVKLTADGEQEFSDVLDLECEHSDQCITVKIDGSGWKKKQKALAHFLWCAAGYCADDDWHKWFIEED